MKWCHKMHLHVVMGLFMLMRHVNADGTAIAQVQVAYAFDSGSGTASDYCGNITTVTSCTLYTVSVMNSTNMTEYEIRYRVTFNSLNFGLLASDPSGAFTASVHSAVKPSYTWLLPSPSTSVFSGWKQLMYPQDDWHPQDPECVGGTSCESLTVAPSMRYQHTAVIYQSWNFERDVLQHQSLCKALGYDNSNCTSTCLVDPICAVNETAPGFASWNLDAFYSLNVAGSFWSQFSLTDDGKDYPQYDPSHVNCPDKCCGDRRVCMRTRDDLGREIPFDKTYMLVFGGRTRQLDYINGEDLYLNCESILANLTATVAANITTTPPLNETSIQQYASCFEDQSEELWRYDISNDIWELVKPNSLETSATDSYPYGRYGHASALVVVPASQDISGTRRQYMFVFGGISIRCVNGLCADMWRYEIPWAAQAYWSTAASTTLNNYSRGNVWKLMSPCPYGGRFRHTMVASTTGDALYIFGGETGVVWQNDLVRYRISSDSWEILEPLGYSHFTRTSVDYLGTVRVTNMTDFSQYNALVDVIADPISEPNSTTVLKYNPQFPDERGDHSALIYSVDWVVDVPAVLNATDNSTITPASSELVPVPVMWVIGGFKTVDQMSGATTSVSSSPNYQYYLSNDIWQLKSNATIWEQVFTASDDTLSVPPARRGAASVVIPRSIPGAAANSSSDNVLLYFGGNRADNLYSGMWMLDFQRTERNDRIWRKIGQSFDNAATPSPVTYHTMNFDGDGTQKVFMFGGLNWTASDLSVSDQLTDADRRCFMSARNIMKTTCTNTTDAVCALNLAKTNIQTGCGVTTGTTTTPTSTTTTTNAVTTTTTAAPTTTTAPSTSTSSSSFCCGADVAGASSLLDLSNLCTTQCQLNSFQADMSLGFGQGMWIYDPSVCLNDCSGNGQCIYSQCFCLPGWSGADCSIQNCPGSFCYYDPIDNAQYCNDCSGNGLCTNSGVCSCRSGWSGADCSSVTCASSCSVNGQCLMDFPVNQCVCQPGFSGFMCETKLCLNNCSLGGSCNSTTGTCTCNTNFYGDDCSVYLTSLAGGILRCVNWWMSVLIPVLGMYAWL